jgi:hypothetical protein
MSKKLITDGTFAASTLNSRSMAYDDFDSDMKKVLDSFNALDTKQRERVLDMIQQIYLDAGTQKGTIGPSLHAPYKNGGGVPDGTSEKNKNFKTIKESIELKENWNSMSHEARDLVLHADNNALLHRSSHEPIIKNLKHKMSKGIYDPEKAKSL